MILLSLRLTIFVCLFFPISVSASVYVCRASVYAMCALSENTDVRINSVLCILSWADDVARRADSGCKST
jgi:hypothetical protein